MARSPCLFPSQCEPGRGPAALLAAVCLVACAGPPRAVTGPGAGVVAYKAAFRRALGGAAEGPVSLAVLWAEVRRARVLLLGDHHGDRAYHRRLLPFLDAVALHVGPLRLFLEFVTEPDRPDLEAFLAGRLSAAAFRRRLVRRDPGGLLAAPGTDAAGLLRLLVHARRRGWPVEPLEPAPGLPLLERDAAMAATLARVLGRHRGRYPVVLVGQAHLLGRGHLRARLRRRSVVVLARGPGPRRGLVRVRPGVYVLRPGACE